MLTRLGTLKTQPQKFFNEGMGGACWGIVSSNGPGVKGISNLTAYFGHSREWIMGAQGK